MRADGDSLARVYEIINQLEQHINARRLTPVFLDGVQRRLDAIDTAYRGRPEYDQLYGPLLEAQTLVYGESGQEQKALEFLKEAVRQTGSVHKLRSKLLKDYVAGHASSRQSAGHQAHHASSVHSRPQTAPARTKVHQSEQSPQPIAQKAEAEPIKRKARRAGKLHLRLKPSRRLGFAVTTAFALLLIGGVIVKVPQVSELTNIVTNHSKITTAKGKYDQLSAQYKECSTKLIAERTNVNTNNLQQLANYNQDVANCQKVLQEQHQAADAYNKLVGVQ